VNVIPPQMEPHLTHIEPSSAEPQRINFAWLLWLRWGAILGQIVIVFAVEFVLRIALPLPPVLCVVGFEIASNAAAALWATRARRITDGFLATILAADILLFSVLLYLTGGPSNPFSFLYLVHIALAAVTLKAPETWALTGLALLGFGLLFVLPPWDGAGVDLHAHHGNMRLHLEGMYAAFGVASVFIVYFVQRVTAALAQRESELATARRLAERHGKFASLATLAAGAAHELSTPLSTIAVVSRELERNLQAQSGCAEAAADVRLIRDQVRRCHEILRQMAADAGPGTGEHPQPARAAQLVELALRDDGDDGATLVTIEPPAAAMRLDVPLRAVAAALRAVLKNARQASSGGQPVEVRVSATASAVRFEVADHGPGMPGPVLERAGEPFFTTKQPGEGMGLGLFLVRALLTRLGGTLEISSQPGEGTRVALLLPARVTPNEPAPGEHA